MVLIPAFPPFTLTVEWKHPTEEKKTFPTLFPSENCSSWHSAVMFNATKPHTESHMSRLITCCLHVCVHFLLAAQRRHILSRRGEQPHGFSGGFGVAIMENQGLLHCEEGDCLVPHVRAGHPSVELALECWAEPHCPVCALPLQNHHLTHAEEKGGEMSDISWIHRKEIHNCESYLKSSFTQLTKLEHFLSYYLWHQAVQTVFTLQSQNWVNKT